MMYTTDNKSKCRHVAPPSRHQHYQVAMCFTLHDSLRSAISIHQPWAPLSVLSENNYETRNWKPHHRGPIIIHASKSFSKAGQALLQTAPVNPF
jgi:hypothetical protein